MAHRVNAGAILQRLAEAEIIERERRMVDRRIKAAKFPTVKCLDSFDFTAFPDLNKALVELARSDYIVRRENIIAVGNSGTYRGRRAQHLQSQPRHDRCEVQVMNRASMVIDAAVNGQGIALARTALAAWDLINKRLVAPLPRLYPCRAPI